MRKIFASTMLATVLTGCVVGPDYKGPPTALGNNQPVRPGFARADVSATVAAAPLARWWEVLNDPLLDTLIMRALADNPNVAVVQARLRQARAQLHGEKANLAPNGSASATYVHARLPPLDLGALGGQSGAASAGGAAGGGAAGGSAGGIGSSSQATEFDLYNVGFDATWEIDLFGGQRRAVEAARADVEAAEANIADAQVSLTAEVAQAYVNLRDRQARIALAARAITTQEQTLGIVRQRFAHGTASDIDVANAQNQLETARAQAAPLDAQRESYLDELAMLVGTQPGALDATLQAPAALPLPPASIAIGDPAALLQRRPDIRAAERMLAANTAKIGQQEAARFPRLSFMGIIGIGGNTPADLTKLDNFAAILAPSLSWNFLDFGRTKAKVDQARGGRDEAEAQYRAKVLSALQDAEDSLSRFRGDRVVVATQARALAAAERSAIHTAERYRGGTVTLTDLLDAQRRQTSAEQDLSMAKANLTNDFVSIQKALGLGWQTL